MEEREADEFNEEAVNEHLQALGKDPLPHGDDHGHAHGHDHTSGKVKVEEKVEDLACGCPGTLSQSFDRPKPMAAPAAPKLGGCPGSQSQSFNQPETSDPIDQAGPVASRLANWPVQISLVPPKAPYLEGADVLIAADCAPFAYGDFHRRFMEGKVLLIGCPKLDNTQAYVEKLTHMFKENSINSVGVVFMEVPCCTGLVQIVQSALEQSGANIPTTQYRVGIKGDFVEERALNQSAA
jgi:hypothetical protein